MADIARLEAPVDLVGHDWGAILALRVAMIRPDLVRTLATGGGPLDLEYRWHDTAVLWQTPEAGEQLMTMFGGEIAIEGLVGGGVPRTSAEETVARIDERMKDAILRLYRSAIDVNPRWAPDLAAIRCPALVIWPVDDPFVDRRFGTRLAAAIHATLLEIDGGHWWPAPPSGRGRHRPRAALAHGRLQSMTRDSTVSGSGEGRFPACCEGPDSTGYVGSSRTPAHRRIVRARERPTSARGRNRINVRSRSARRS